MTGRVTQWRQDGFLVLPSFKPPAAIAALRTRSLAIVDALVIDGALPVFSTRDRQRVADAALLASADKVHCFFEEDAVDAEGRLVVPKDQAVNKIGHALHDLDPVFERFSRDPALAELARDLGLERALLMQSMLIFKQPRIGGEVNWHQDASFLATDPHSVIGFWFALEDATRDNGCLWVEPGGHRGPLRERYGRTAEGLKMARLDDTPWPVASRTVALEVPAGTLVVFDGMLPHASAVNRSAQSRMAYTLTWWTQRRPGRL